MKKLHFISFFLLFLCCQSLVTAQTTVTDPLPAAEKSEEVDLIHFGDLIDVDVLGSVEHDWRGTLTPEGFLKGIEFTEDPIYALCQNVETVAQAVTKGYSKLLRDPKVRVRILDRSNRPTSVIYGAIKNEQRFRINRPVYLNELIVLAGGFTEKASGVIQIFRPQNLSCVINQKEKHEAGVPGEARERFVPTSQTAGANNFNIKISELLKGEKEANPQVFSGDIITVLEAEPVYVIGGVNSPKHIAVRTEITLSRAVASAGGLSKDADPKTITVFRREGRETKVIQADYEKIEANQSEDIILQPYDVVEVGIKGRGKSKFPPIVKVYESTDKTGANLPLRIID